MMTAHLPDIGAQAFFRDDVIEEHAQEIAQCLAQPPVAEKAVQDKHGADECLAQRSARHAVLGRLSHPLGLVARELRPSLAQLHLMRAAVRGRRARSASFHTYFNM